MTKTSVHQDKYLELMNQLLQEQPDFVDGMAFVPAPPGSSGPDAWGYDCTTEYTKTGAYANAARLAREMYEVIPRK